MIGNHATRNPFYLVQFQGDMTDVFLGHYFGRAKGSNPYTAAYKLAWKDARGKELQWDSERVGHRALTDPFSRGDVLCRNIQLAKRKLTPEVVALIKAQIIEE